MSKRILILICAMLVFRVASSTDIEQLEKSAAQGDAVAQEEMGRIFAYGVGVPQDAPKGAAWFRKAYEGFRAAAEHGSADGQFHLGKLYASGRGVARDEQKSNEWYRKAAEQGHGPAQLFLSFAYEHAYGVPKDDAKAVEWLHKSAEGGYTVAQVQLARRYEKGGGVRKDGVKAVEWYRKAALQGRVDMQMELEGIYKGGRGVPKDEIEALAWLNIAAAAEDRVRPGELDKETYTFGSESVNQAFRIKFRNLMEAHLGREATLIAQQRSKEILKEMEAAKFARASIGRKDSAAAMSPAGEAPKATGSGAIVSTEGHVLTAAHVVAGAGRLNIITAQGMKAAKVLRVDEANDLAVLKLADGTFPALPVAPSRKVRLGPGGSDHWFPEYRNSGLQSENHQGRNQQRERNR